MYMLPSNELVTESELFQGLTRIGQEYGKSSENFQSVRRLKDLIQDGTTKLSEKARQEINRETDHP